MNFSEAESYLYSLGNEVEAMKLGLENIRTLLEALGNPQNNYTKVQVAGTNGKGSVCAFLNSICLRAGIETGLYTSPHLVSITERIRIDGVDISESEFARLATHVRETAEKLLESGLLSYRPTFFEQVTAIALRAFSEARVELAILETGLGGRLDATTAANAEICAITRIDLDHQQYLGDTIEEIAAEKAAIIRKESRVFVGKQFPPAQAVIKKQCADLGIKPTTLENARWTRYALGYEFTIDGFSIDEVEIPLHGDHQVENAALAILIARKLRRFIPVSKKVIVAGIEGTIHPGRLEYVKGRKVQVILDGAHNPGGAEALAKYLRVDNPEEQSIALVFAAMEDKNVREMLGSLAPEVNDIILTEAPNRRSMAASRIADAVCKQIGFERLLVVPDAMKAFETAIELAQGYTGTRWKVVVVTGSLYLVGEIRKMLLENPEFEVIRFNN